MPYSSRPVVVVSKCLGFAACRYDGQIVPSPAVNRLKSRVRFIPVCPELEIGLGVPRQHIRIVETRGRRRLVQPATGRDCTLAMNRFSSEFLSSPGGVDGFILKSRSPSCGLKDVKVYRDDGPLSKPVSGRGTGFFASAVLERFPGLAVVDDIGLEDPAVRKVFLVRLFAHSAWRRSERTKNVVRSKISSPGTGQGRAG